jgi:hypothetical protein
MTAVKVNIRLIILLFVLSEYYRIVRLVLVILGPTLLGMPVCIWLLLRREYLFIVGGSRADECALLCALPVLYHPTVTRHTV